MNELLSKHGQCVTKLAQLLIHSKATERLPSMQAIASEQGVSVGTVQAAMQYLQAGGMVTVENRGRLGAYVQDIDYVKLWQFAYQHTMIGMLPMPYSKRIEGLATGLRDLFSKAGFDVDMRFMRGSTARILRLHAHQCDWVVVSRYALETALVHGFDVEIIFELGPRTYMVDHVLIINHSDTLKPGMRVGIDTHSTDHAYVVRLLSRGIPVTFVDIDYSTSLELLLRGEIDATVWTEHEQLVLPDHVFVRQLTEEFLTEGVFGMLGEAVIVARSDAGAIANVLHATLDIDTLRKTQLEVLDGQRRPAY